MAKVDKKKKDEISAPTGEPPIFELMRRVRESRGELEKECLYNIISTGLSHQLTNDCIARNKSAADLWDKRRRFVESTIGKFPQPDLDKMSTKEFFQYLEMCVKLQEARADVIEKLAKLQKSGADLDIGDWAKIHDGKTNSSE